MCSNKDDGDDEDDNDDDNDDSDNSGDGIYESRLHRKHVLIVNYLKSIFKVL